MTEKIEIEPRGPLHASIRPPGSKSITNRALVCAALADGRSTLVGALDSEDTRVMIDALRTLGLEVTHDPQAATIRVIGCDGRIPRYESPEYRRANEALRQFDIERPEILAAVEQERQARVERHMWD